MIQLEQVSKIYRSSVQPAVAALSLQVAEGETVVLLGGSGCGKTTTLKMINRLVEPTSGRILVGGEDTARIDPVQLRRRIGYVFQGIGLFPHVTVAGNIAAVPRLLGRDSSWIERRVDTLLDLMGLPPDEYRHRYPRQLSGGQQQRVGVARALAAEPRLMLLDEPFGALDPITRDSLQTEMKTIRRRLGLTIVMVTHDMTEALLMADRIAVMESGRIVQIGTPHQLMTSPLTPFVEQLMAAPKRQADALEAIAQGEPDSNPEGGAST
jgi:osmoprotectant transport system ATP-binding protein